MLINFVVIPRRNLSSVSSNGHTLFPFRNRPLPISSRDPPLPAHSATDLLTTRNSIVLILPAAGAIFLRVELFRLILGNRQCSLSGTEVRMTYFDNPLRSAYVLEGAFAAPRGNLRMVVYPRAKFCCSAEYTSYQPQGIWFWKGKICVARCDFDRWKHSYFFWNRWHTFNIYMPSLCRKDCAFSPDFRGVTRLLCVNER